MKRHALHEVGWAAGGQVATALGALLDAVPALGEHSRAILGELGYSEREVQAFASSGVI